jgi:DNA-binding beta-propeller fold protein YncE
MLNMTLFYSKIRILSCNKVVNSVAVSTLAVIVLASTFASVNGQDAAVKTWGSLGSAPGQFNDPAGIVVDPTGYVFVVDSHHNRIQRFTSNGLFVSTWGSLGSGPGQFQHPTGMTVQYPSGKVFVADTGNSRIQEFDNNGKFIRQINAGTSFDSSDNIDLDVDSNDKIYLTDRNDDHIIILSP